MQRLYGLTHVILAETRQTVYTSQETETFRDVTVRLAIPSDRVAALCAAIMGGKLPEIDESKATVEQWGRA